MKVLEFVETIKKNKIMNNKVNGNAVHDYLNQNLEIREYLPFRTKREIAELIVAQTTTEVDGVLYNDSINQYIGFVVAMITAHTNLEFSEDPVADYDLLAESGLLPQIIAEFRTSYDECEAILKMALSMTLEHNNLNSIIGKFLGNILGKLDSVADVLKNNLGDFDIKKVLGENFKEEDVAKLLGFLDRLA